MQKDTEYTRLLPQLLTARQRELGAGRQLASIPPVGVVLVTCFAPGTPIVLPGQRFTASSKRQPGIVLSEHCALRYLHVQGCSSPADRASLVPGGRVAGRSGSSVASLALSGIHDSDRACIVQLLSLRLSKCSTWCLSAFCMGIEARKLPPHLRSATLVDSAATNANLSCSCVAVHKLDSTQQQIISSCTACAQ